MSAEADLLYSKKPFVLTLKGRITVHYLDGQTIEGEIAAQDELNIWLTIDATPHLVPRSQIRYIKGKSGQQIEAEVGQGVAFEASPALRETSAGTPLPEAEPMAHVAQFVEEGEETPIPAGVVAEEAEAPPADDDLGGTAVIPPLAAKPTPTEAKTAVSAPVPDDLADTGMTIILGPEADAITSVADAKERQDVAPSPRPEPTLPDSGETEFLPSLEFDDDNDATFILGEPEEKEVSAHLICTTGPHAGEVYQLKHGVTTMGRSSDNSFPLSKDKEASRRHTIIVYEAGKFVVQDQNSLNGTFLNDQLIKGPQPLTNGDIILIGISTLKFQER